jgi:benzoyl-CoA reductase/2-hydroxyglutaryl-CoA dehydratase subunit BcrC/BadD/HgdB
MDRPEGMKYFDFVMSEVHGLRIRELLAARREGRKVVGSFCVFVPEELVLAVEGVFAGAEFNFEGAETLLPRTTCAPIHSAFGFKLAQVCSCLEALDLVAGENTCDGKKRAFEIFAGLVDRYFARLRRVHAQPVAPGTRPFDDGGARTVRRDARRRGPRLRPGGSCIISA